VNKPGKNSWQGTAFISEDSDWKRVEKLWVTAMLFGLYRHRLPQQQKYKSLTAIMGYLDAEGL